MRAEQMAAQPASFELEPWDEPHLDGPMPADLVERALELRDRQHRVRSALVTALGALTRQHAFAERVDRATARVDAPGVRRRERLKKEQVWKTAQVGSAAADGYLGARTALPRRRIGIVYVPSEACRVLCHAPIPSARCSALRPRRAVAAPAGDRRQHRERRHPGLPRHAAWTSRPRCAAAIASRQPRRRPRRAVTTATDTPVGANDNNVDLRKETLAAIQSQFQYQMMTRAVERPLRPGQRPWRRGCDGRLRHAAHRQHQPGHAPDLARRAGPQHRQRQHGHQHRARPPSRRRC